MPKAFMGDIINVDKKSNFLLLKNKDEKVHIRFIRPDYNYDGKHFQQEDGKWVISPCNRINNDEYCELCEVAKTVRNEIKNTTDEKAKEALKEKQRRYEPKISFYYPVLDRESGVAKIFQTTLSIRLKIEDRVKDGEKILEKDYIIKRTEKPGSEYYTMERLDSSDTKELTEAEVKEVTTAQAWDLDKLINAQTKKSVMDIDEAEKVFVSNDEIPF